MVEIAAGNRGDLFFAGGVALYSDHMGRFSEIETCVGAGDFAGAEAACARMAERENDNPGFWLMRGDVALMGAQWADAEAHYRWAAALMPEAGKAWLGIARATSSAGRNQAGAVAAARALNLGLPDALAIAAQEIIAQAHFASGDKAAGRAALAALVPLYRAQHLKTDGALAAALCAGDTGFTVEVMQALYPQAGALAPLAIAPTAKLEAWCRDAGVSVRVIDPQRAVDIPPSNLHSVRFAYTTDPILFASLPGGMWIPGWDFAIAPDGTVLEDSGYFRLDQVFNHAPHAFFPAAARVAHHAPEDVVEVDADVLWVGAPMHDHFGHWLIDFVPRLIGRTYCPPGVKIAVPDTLTGAKFMETLMLAGVAESDILRCRVGARYRFRTLHVYRPGRSMPPHPAHAAYLQEVLRGGRAGKPTPGKRYFLSRARIGTRLAINHAEFEGCLRANGFITVDLGDLTSVQQRALFADAEVLLGAVGSDLLAMYFAPPGCTVISLQWALDIDPCQPAAAAILGMRQQFLLCPETRPSRNARNALDQDFVVDCAELTRRLAGLTR